MRVTKLRIWGAGSFAAVVAVVDGLGLRLLISKLSSNATLNRGIFRNQRGIVENRPYLTFRGWD
jgi:hypothetical protein